MRTSTTQFEMLINFMEKHGDLNKPTKEAHGRVQCIQKWDKLKDLLNSDPTGEVKSVEKWKKVRSDLKNNTKKKTAKLNRSIRGTGGGPAHKMNLNEIKKKVLRIIGIQAVTGIPCVREEGLLPQSQAPVNQEAALPDSNRTETLTFTPPHDEESPSIITFQNSINILGTEIWMQPSTSRQTHVPPSSPIQPVLPAPALSPAYSPEPVLTPASSPAPAPTPPRARTPAQSQRAPALRSPLERPAHRETTPGHRRRETVRRGVRHRGVVV